MSNEKTTELTLKEALSIVQEYSCIQLKTVDSSTEKAKLREALMIVTNSSEHENIGICADNSKQGFATLSSYLQALGYEPNLSLDSLPKVNAPVYIKFNTQNMSYYLDSYIGGYRGVLVSCYGDDQQIVGTYGHFPLDLFN